MVIFGQQDLSRSAPFPRIDLVLCRNVLIYFTPELQDTVLSQFAFSLYPNGYLFLGKAETVRPVQTFYELVNKQQTAIYVAELSREVRPDEKIVWDNTFTPIMDDEEPGKVRFILVAAVDLTEQLRMQRELEQSGYLKDE